MPKSTEYKYIKAWGKLLGSYEYYIVGEQEHAVHDNAPMDAVYYREMEKRWVTIDECVPETQAAVRLHL